MYLSKARQLREDRAKLAKDAQSVLDNPALSKEERNRKFDKMMADAERMGAEINRLERPENGLAVMAGGSLDQRYESEPDREHRAAFNAYLRKGHVGLTSDQRNTLAEYRDMGTGGGNALQGTGGGYFVPVGFVQDVENALKFFGEMLRGGAGDPRIYPTETGQPLPWPTSNDTTIEAEQIGENQLVSDQDVTLGNIVFGAFKYSTKMVKVSLELLQDSAFDIQSFLVEQFSIRLGRTLNAKFTTGVGSTEPKGIVVASTLGATAVGSATNDGVVGNDGTISVGSDDLIALEHSLDRLYRRGAKFMMHDSTLQKLKGVKDKYGRPLWIPGIANNAPDTIGGYEFLVNNSMDEIGGPNSPPVQKKSVLFGQMPKYIIRRVKGMTVLRLEERYAEYGQVAFIGFARYDGNLLDAGTHPVKYLQQASY